MYLGRKDIHTTSCHALDINTLDWIHIAIFVCTSNSSQKTVELSYLSTP